MLEDHFQCHKRSCLHFWQINELFIEGYNVITTGDGSHVMEIIDQEKPDLIVLDIRLGKYSGLDILQDIKNSYHDLPVILCSAYPILKRNKKSKPADDFVVKSRNVNELKSKIRMALEVSQTVQDN